jgi:hypothetical protein
MIDKPTLQFFGCSFTSLETSDTGYVFNNFKNVVSEKTNYSFNDRSKVGRSNEQIIDDVYTYYNINLNNLNRGNDIYVIQFSFNDRFGIYSDLVDKFISMCKIEKPDDYTESIFVKFYNDWLKYFYSRKGRIREFKKQVDFLCSWLRSNNVKFICFGMDHDMDSEYYGGSFYERNNFIKFENTHSLYGYACMNKLRIADIPEYNIPNMPSDYHLNNDGHIYIANKILEKIENKKFY